jgi:group I intron endonuclease
MVIMKKCGIYQIKCNITNKIYIGHSIDIERRWNQHKYGKGNLLLRNAIKKYGIDNFEFTILEEIDLNSNNIKQILFEREQYWFDVEKPYMNGFNIDKIAKPNTPFEHDVNFGSKISRIKIENNHTGKPIKQYDLDGNFIKEWPSSASVERELGFSARNVGGCAQGNAFTSNGFIWLYKQNVLTEEYLNKVKNKRPREKQVYQYSLAGKLVESYNSVKEASKKTGFDYGCITHTCRGGWATYRGFMWSYYELIP